MQAGSACSIFPQGQHQAFADAKTQLLHTFLAHGEIQAEVQQNAQHIRNASAVARCGLSRAAGVSHPVASHGDPLRASDSLVLFDVSCLQLDVSHLVLELVLLCDSPQCFLEQFYGRNLERFEEKYGPLTLDNQMQWSRIRV